MFNVGDLLEIVQCFSSDWVGRQGHVIMTRITEDGTKRVQIKFTNRNHYFEAPYHYFTHVPFTGKPDWEV